MPLTERRYLLAPVIQGAAPGIILSEEVDADGDAFLKLACKLGLEGIIAKRRDAPYRSGRGGEWRKIKCVQSEGFFIIGYEPSSSALGGIGRLLLAAWKNNRMTYVGGVGTGFSDRTATALRKRLDALQIDKPALKLTRKGTRWVSPSLVAEIEFRGWTNDQKLRQASYKGLRDVADAADVLRLDEVRN